MTTSNPIPDPVNEESQTLHPADPSLASAVAPQKEERDYLVIGLIIALMAIVVAGFFSLDSKMDRLITQMGVDTQKTGLNAWMGAPTNRGNARVDCSSHSNGCPSRCSEDPDGCPNRRAL